MDCFNPTLVQVQICFFFRQTIIKMTGKMATASQFASIVVTLTLSFVLGFLPNLIFGLLPSNPGSSLNMSFVRQTITKMADKRPPPISLCPPAAVVTLT